MANFDLDLHKNVIIFDGAMGTMLQKFEVLKPGEAPEILNITKPEVVAAVHKAYAEAGSNCVETNTFGGNRIKLETEGLGDKVREVNYNAIKIAKKAVGDNLLVAASLGPTGKMLQPLGDLSFDEAYQCFLEQCQIFAEAGADLINIETMSDLLEVKAAIIAALNVNIPVMASVSFMENGRTLTGFTPEMVGAVLSGFPVLALGTNCGMSAGSLIPIVSKLASHSQKPLIVQPNAGKPVLDGGQTIYQESIAEYTQNAVELVKLGARVIGGCCGTSPEHIKALKARLHETNCTYQLNPAADFLVGKRDIIPFFQVQSGTEKKQILLEGDLWQGIKNGDLDSFLDLVLNIDSEKFRIIELNALHLANEDPVFLESVAATLATYWPNCISAHVASPEQAKIILKNNPGRTLIYSKPDNNIENIVHQYGGVFQEI